MNESSTSTTTIKQVVNGGKESFANSADSSRGDYLDEEAERQAFKEAVEEWRRQDAESKTAVAAGGGGGGGVKSSVRIEREYLKDDKGLISKGSTASSSISSSSSIVQLSSGRSNDWKNPFAAAPASREDVSLRTNLSAVSPRLASLCSSADLSLLPCLTLPSSLHRSSSSHIGTTCAGRSC